MALITRWPGTRAIATPASRSLSSGRRLPRNASPSVTNSDLVHRPPARSATRTWAVVSLAAANGASLYATVWRGDAGAGAGDDFIPAGPVRGRHERLADVRGVGTGRCEIVAVEPRVARLAGSG